MKTSSPTVRPTIRSTVACVIQQGEHFLMVEEDKGGAHTLFNQPAGHVELGAGGWNWLRPRARCRSFVHLRAGRGVLSSELWRAV